MCCGSPFDDPPIFGLRSFKHLGNSSCLQQHHRTFELERTIGDVERESANGMAASIVALVWPCEQRCVLATLIRSINVQLSTLATMVPKSLRCEALWKPRLYNDVRLNQIRKILKHPKHHTGHRGSRFCPKMNF